MSEPPVPAPESNGAERDQDLRFQVGSFDGPLDLLLHLVRANEIDVTDIPIVEIANQYQTYLDLMTELRLEVAGEYLVMAATLMHIKSRMLLPPDPAQEGEDGEEDPRAGLVQQLLEYQRFKQAAENLQAMDSRRSLVWTRDQVPEEFRDEELLAVGLFDLMNAFQDLLRRLDEDSRIQLRRDNVSVAEKIHWLTELLEQRRSFELLSLMQDLPTKLDRIATFLAILEMIRLRIVVAFQRKLFDEIRIAKIEEPETDAPEIAGDPDDGPVPPPGSDGGTGEETHDLE